MHMHMYGNDCNPTLHASTIPQLMEVLLVYEHVWMCVYTYIYIHMY